MDTPVTARVAITGLVLLGLAGCADAPPATTSSQADTSSSSGATSSESGTGSGTGGDSGGSGSGSASYDFTSAVSFTDAVTITLPDGVVDAVRAEGGNRLIVDSYELSHRYVDSYETCAYDMTINYADGGLKAARTPYRELTEEDIAAGMVADTEVETVAGSIGINGYADPVVAGEFDGVTLTDAAYVSDDLTSATVVGDCASVGDVVFPVFGDDGSRRALATVTVFGSLDDGLSLSGEIKGFTPTPSGAWERG